MTVQKKRNDKSDKYSTAQSPHIERPNESLETTLEKEKNPVKRFFKMLGPGLVTGASDDDPSGIGTYAQAGAALGFSTLWLALITFPLQWGIQFTAQRSEWSREWDWPAC